MAASLRITVRVESRGLGQTVVEKSISAQAASGEDLRSSRHKITGGAAQVAGEVIDLVLQDYVDAPQPERPDPRSMPKLVLPEPDTDETEDG